MYGTEKDQIVIWLKELINNLPKKIGMKDSEFSTVSMLEEGLGLYLSFEQDPYWAVESLLKYLLAEQVPIPDKILKEMIDLAEGKTKIKLERIKQKNNPVSFSSYVSSLENIKKEV